MAWTPKFGWKRGGARANATTVDDTDDDTDLDDIEPIDDDDDEEETPEEASTTPTPAATSDADLRAENERLKAENAKLAAKAGEQTLQGAQSGAVKAAVRLFGQGTPKLKEAKKLVALASTPDEADAFRAAWELAFGATPIAGLGAVRQTKTTPTPDADADAAARAKAAAARTRPKGIIRKED